MKPNPTLAPVYHCLIIYGNYFLSQQVVGSMDVPNKMVVHIPGTAGSGGEEPSDSDDTSD